MALWSIRKLRPQPPEQVILDCTDGKVAHEITLVDNETGTNSVIVACWSPDPRDICINMNMLRGAGYTPADWDEECAS